MPEKIEPYKGIASIYEEIRPSYPDKLIEDIIEKTGIKPSDRLLEIGAGTGKATMQFVEKGFTIDAVELGEDMAAVFRDKLAAYPHVKLEVSAFEDWNPGENTVYDMIYSAQTFHWLDANVKYKKCRSLLKEGGYLALFWYSPCSAMPETLAMEAEIQKIVVHYTVQQFEQTEKPERRAHDGVTSEDARQAEIEASGCFEFIEKIDYTYEIKNDARQYLLAQKSVPAFAALLDTMESNEIAAMDREIEKVINRHGEYVPQQFLYTLYLAKKIE